MLLPVRVHSFLLIAIYRGIGDVCNSAAASRRLRAVATARSLDLASSVDRTDDALVPEFAHGLLLVPTFVRSLMTVWLSLDVCRRGDY